MTGKMPALACLLAAALATGCVDSVRNPTVLRGMEQAKAPEAPVMRNLTNFDESLQCMDMLMLDNGVRDVVVMTEDLSDSTKRVNVGARDMLISAVSEMTRRSRAVRLIAAGSDTKNQQEWWKNSGVTQKVFNFQPDYNIRGSLSQLDENLAQQDKQLGLTGVLGLGTRSSANTSILALDLSVISMKSAELLPGVTSKNSVLVIRSSEGTGSGQDGKGGVGFSATIGKAAFGVAYNFNISRSDGVGGAARNLIELATIELFGKLLRIPYWQCLGLDAQHPAIKREIDDWYYNLVHEGKLIEYIQNQLRVMGRYHGPLKGGMNRDLTVAIQDFLAKNNLPPKDSIDAETFSHILNKKDKNAFAIKAPLAHLSEKELSQRYETRSKVPVGLKSAAPGSPPPLSKIDVKMSAGGVKSWKPGDPMRVQVTTSKDAFVYCYLETDKSLMRIFPNPRSADPLVKAGQSVWVPNDGELSVALGTAKQKESVSCFASDSDPAMVAGPKPLGRAFEPHTSGLAEVRALVGGTAESAFGHATFQIPKK